MLLAADLVVAGVTGTAASYSTGNFLHAVAHIDNDGTLLSNSGPFNLEFWLSRVGGAQKFRFIESGFVANVLRGIPASDEINLPGWAIPTNIPQGTYRVAVFLDTGNGVAEEDEDNNAGSSATFTIGQPDLEVPLVAVDRTAYGRGQFLNATATIENTGLGSTFAQSPFGFNLSFFLGSVDTSNRTQFPIETGFVSFLSAGQSTTDIINAPGWIIPSNVANGEYRVWVRADSGGDVVESDEGNNFGSSPIIRIGQPDLVIDSVVLDQSVYAYNDLLTAVATIRNAGPGSTLQESPLGFNVSFYLGAVDATTDADRMQVDLQQAFVTFLNGGQSTTDNLNKLILPTFQPGEYRLWVKADSGNDVSESNEDNNWRGSQVLTIQGARWEDEHGNATDDALLEATPVYLAVYTEQVGAGTNIPVNIFEDDTLGNDLLEAVTLKHVSTPGGHKWQRRWIPYRTSDQLSELPGGIGGDPEYFFRVDNSDHLPGLFDASSNITVLGREPDDEFGVLLVEHTTGTGVPLILVHGNNSDLSFDLYRWKGFLDRIESHPTDFAEFDVWLWKHDTSKPVGFSGAPATTADPTDDEDRSQAVRLAEFVYGDRTGQLAFGRPGSRYPDTKLALVAHSQGGMVSRSFMNTFNPQRGHRQGEDVAMLVTLGTPHHGSPFGIEDWVAVLWSQLIGTGSAAEDSFEDHLRKELGQDPGDINLAWDNLDGVVLGRVESFDGSKYVLTPKDTNQLSNFPNDPNVIYSDDLKNDHGTLAHLNLNEGFLHKLVAVGAYDSDLSDNITPLELLAKFLANGSLPEHEGLDAVTNLMSLMSGLQLGNLNPSNYIANDGLVPLQSALMLNLPPTGVSIASLGAGGSVTPMDALIDALTPRDMFHHYFSSAQGIGDHADILETAADFYWQPITDHLRNILETERPVVAAIDPANTATIDPLALNTRRYIEVTFADAGDSTLDPTSLLDDAPEFRLVGPAAAGVTLDGAPQRLGGDGLTYRYFFTGDFAVVASGGGLGSSGAVSVEFIEGSFADDAGNENARQSFAFNLTGAVPPDRFGYAVSDAGDHFGLVDLDTGAFHLVGQLRSADGLTIFTDVENLAIDPATGAIYGVDGGTLLTIDPATAIATVIGDTGLTDVDALTFNPAGELFAVDAVPTTNPGELFQIDKTTATATRLTALLMPVPDELVAMGAIDPQLDGIAFDPTGRLIAAYSSYGSMSFIVEVELATGQILNIGAAGVDDIEDLAVGSDGVLYGTLGDTGAVHGQPSKSLEGLVTIDPVTGAATAIGRFGPAPLADGRWDIEGLAIAPVSQPATNTIVAEEAAQPLRAPRSAAALASSSLDVAADDAAPSAVTLIPRVRVGPLSVAVSAPRIDPAAGAYRFTVHYSGAGGVDPRSLGAGNLRVTGRGLPRARIVDTLVQDDGSVTATYELAVPTHVLAAAVETLAPFRIDLLANTVRDRLGQATRFTSTLASILGTPPLFSVTAPLGEELMVR